MKVAVIVTTLLTAGFHEQLAVKELPELEIFFVHPAIDFPFALKFTVPAKTVYADRDFEVRKTG